jgi:hypothetical protein
MFDLADLSGEPDGKWKKPDNMFLHMMDYWLS